MRSTTSVTDPTASPLGRRILLWGGGGKTTLSHALGAKLDLPVVELDALFHKPSWEERDPGEFRKLVTDTLAVCEEGWIVDGQYLGALGAEALGHADTLIWLELPFRTTFGRVFKRTIKRVRDKQRICGDNYETWGKAFFSRDSLLLYLLKRRLFHHRETLYRRENMIREYGSGLRIIRLKSAKALNRFYVEHELVRV
ncbi:MAG: hypothetical protein CL724_09030 [Chloroflexi bacterium]|nr:hypothetical protein [Chloroflexota bacterium]